MITLIGGPCAGKRIEIPDRVVENGYLVMPVPPKTQARPLSELLPGDPEWGEVVYTARIFAVDKYRRVSVWVYKHFDGMEMIQELLDNYKPEPIYQEEEEDERTS